MHKVRLEEAKEIFGAARKIGSDEVKKRYLDDLVKEITLVFKCLCYQRKALELQETIAEIAATVNELPKMRDELKEKEKELQRQREELASLSSDTSQMRKALDA